VFYRSLSPAHSGADSFLQVIATGPGLPHPTTGNVVPPVIKPGDRILLPAFGGQQIKVEGEEEVRFDRLDLEGLPLTHKTLHDQEFTIYRESEIVAKLSE
jgi:Chaperonin 10 Kd subunit